MDRPRTTIARSETAQWFSPGRLEHTGQRWREDAGARLSLIGVQANDHSMRPGVVRSRQSRSRREYSRSRSPLEIVGEMDNYSKLDTDFS